jgi:serine O-acetyltransferase
MPNAIIFYRIARWLYLHKIPFIPKVLRAIIFLLYNSKVPFQNKIGKGTYFICSGIGVALVEGTEIGENCRIGINVVCSGKGPYKNLPKLGNNIWIGPGAIVTGAVIIEDNVVIAPNSVVTKSVPEGAIVGGIPAKIIGWVKDLDYELLKNEAWKEGYMDFLTVTKQK